MFSIRSRLYVSIDADFCDQIRVGIGILFEKEVEKKGAWKTLEETGRELHIG